MKKVIFYNGDELSLSFILEERNSISIDNLRGSIERSIREEINLALVPNTVILQKERANVYVVIVRY